MKRFDPSSTYSSPSRRAVVRIAAESEPEPASVSAYAASTSPEASRGQEPRSLLLRPRELEPERAELLHGEDQPARRADLRDLLDRDEREQRRRCRCRRAPRRRGGRRSRARGRARRRPTGTRATRRSRPRAARCARVRACARARGSRAARRSAAPRARAKSRSAGLRRPGADRFDVVAVWLTSGLPAYASMATRMLTAARSLLVCLSAGTVWSCALSGRE